MLKRYSLHSRPKPWLSRSSKPHRQDVIYSFSLFSEDMSNQPFADLFDKMYQLWCVLGMEIEKKIQANFFKTGQNNEPVRDFLKALSPEDKKSVGADIMAVEMLWPIGYPMVRKLDTDLWEVRTGISDKRICRIMFTVSGNTMILLDLFDNCVVE